MSARKQKPADHRSGEAGHQGHDRQPAKSGVNKSEGETPDSSEAASPREVGERSEEAAAMKNQPQAAPDIAHPGPDRYEAEKAKGNAHHNQNERDSDMHKKMKKL